MRNDFRASLEPAQASVTTILLFIKVTPRHLKLLLLSLINKPILTHQEKKDSIVQNQWCIVPRSLICSRARNLVVHQEGSKSQFKLGGWEVQRIQIQTTWCKPPDSRGLSSSPEKMSRLRPTDLDKGPLHTIYKLLTETAWGKNSNSQFRR
jgi:hypothetical protein